MNAGAQGVTLLLLGAAVLHATLTDRHLRYVKPSLGPFLVAAGVVLVLTAVVTLYHEHRREQGGGRPPGEAAEPHGDHGHHRLRVAWLLLLPVVGLLLVSPAALGSYAAERSGTAVSGPAGGMLVAALPDGDPVPLTLLDYASRAVHGRGATLGDRRVRLTGFLVIGRDGEPYLARMTLSCCAADGQPIKIGLAGQIPVGHPADTWVTVVGTYTSRAVPDPINGEPIPYLDVEQWKRIRPPTQQYE